MPDENEVIETQSRENQNADHIKNGLCALPFDLDFKVLKDGLCPNAATIPMNMTDADGKPFIAVVCAAHWARYATLSEINRLSDAQALKRAQKPFASASKRPFIAESRRVVPDDRVGNHIHLTTESGETVIGNDIIRKK